MLNTLSDSFDIWTTAQSRKSKGRGRGTDNLSHYGVQKLRELILELAVRGKLVPQDPSDESASELLKRINEEKDRLIKEDKIRKHNDLPEIRNDEIQIELPQGWEFIRNGKLFSLRKGKKPKNISDENIGLPYLDIEALDRGNIFQFTDDDKCPLSSDEDILVVCDGSRSGLILKGKKGVVGSTLAVIDTPLFIQPYVRLIFKEGFQRWNTSMKGAAIPHLDTKKLILEIIGLPPLPEQHRIVTKVEELMSLCDKLEQQQNGSAKTHEILVNALLDALANVKDSGELQANWQRIENNFDILFTTDESIDKLKQTILQFAVMGKLVPQDAKDEPASELLKRIVEEKKKLIEEGKIKKQNPLPEITDQEKPFKLPLGWIWSRFGNLINLISGQHLRPQEYHDKEEKGMIPYLTGPAEFGTKFPSATRFTLEKRAIACKGNILITCKGAGIGKINIADKNIAISRQLMAIQPLVVNSDYITIIVESINKIIRESMIGIAIPGISREDVTNLIVLLPPAAEQQRIVAKVDELFAICEELKGHIKSTEEIKLQLADTVVDWSVV